MKKISIDELGQIDETAQAFLLKTDLEAIPIGRVDLGQGYFVNVDSYQTKSYELRKYESHKKYIDVQYIVYGQENIFIAPIDKLTVLESYNDIDDIIFYNNNFHGEKICLNKGEMAVFYPQDGHMPCVADTQPQMVKKIVIKIPIKRG